MTYLSDIEIAQACTMQPITEIAERAHVKEEYLEPYGRYKAKVDLSLLENENRPNGKLVLVTAITPTPAGEGKTTTTIGLADGLRRIGKDVTVALREPSLGPVFGVKGGAAGGGYAQSGAKSGNNHNCKGENRKQGDGVRQFVANTLNSVEASVVEAGLSSGFLGHLFFSLSHVLL